MVIENCPATSIQLIFSRSSSANNVVDHKDKPEEKKSDTKSKKDDTGKGESSGIKKSASATGLNEEPSKGEKSTDSSQIFIFSM